MCGHNPCDKPTCSWSEDYRRQCEARTVMRWDRIKRTEYYADVKKRRGEAAAQDSIRAQAEHIRRSLGQKARWQAARLEK